MKIGGIRILGLFVRYNEFYAVRMGFAEEL
jgi:hypothetical protein